MLEKSCEVINKIDTQLSVNPDDSILSSEDFPGLINYCPLVNNDIEHKCSSYEELVSSAFITLLVSFISNNGDEYLDRGNFAEYAILWLCYQVNQKEENTIDNLNDFHNKYIKGIENYIVKKPNTEAYNSYKNIIDKKQNSMPIGIKEMSKLYEALKILCDMYNEYKKNTSNCAKCLDEANNFAVKYNDLNNDSNHKEGSLYSQILSTLSKDYNKLKEECDNGQSKKFPSLPQIIPPKSSTHTYGETDIQFSDVETSSSSITSTLIPVLLAFAIPVFLGISYKYSLFGFDKQLQRQYLREKLKKIKKKMNHYI
ncbi:Plasmodium variant antigen protein Cir/Yir/Bir, putative [Plasmodium chabaudi adami]|uniref:Plasmodium variant antigen protein Cir/Yir/Bir, putative n=1 Tax=Plasmodium chabaudi adami TaxID=5826 RepID=A0A1D3L9U9_PLACE|nr:Plasmodium variant antigen protein Cir/Yir/Bir, putative [Plasmodium chabaudi adami]